MRLKLVAQQDLTPNDSDPHTYLLTLASETPIDYQPGDWLTVKGRNPKHLVESLIERLRLNPSQTIELRRVGDVTVEAALTDHLELTLLDPAILNKLMRQYNYQAWSSRPEMQAYAQGKDILDLLDAFPELCDLGVEFLTLLSPLAPRYYSIASAPINPKQVDLLYKAIRYQSHGRERVGVTSSWMQQAEVGQELEVELKPNAHFKLPESPQTPIVMLAAGTGLAPFIGFMQQRASQAAKDNWLIFGETHQATRFLCREQLLSWQAQELLRLDTAFSRDQQPKIYVQDVLMAHHQAWLSYWEQGAITYVCGDKNGLALGVETAIKSIWQQAYGWDIEASHQAWLDAKKQGRIQLDVY